MHVEESSRENHTAVLRVVGDVDFDTCSILSASVDRVIGQGHRLLVINLIDSKYVDSTAFACILDTYRRLHALGGQLALVVNDKNVLRVLGITGLDRTFKIFRDEKEALRAVSHVRPARLRAIVESLQLLQVDYEAWLNDLPRPRMHGPQAERLRDTIGRIGAALDILAHIRPPQPFESE